MKRKQLTIIFFTFFFAVTSNAMQHHLAVLGLDHAASLHDLENRQRELSYEMTDPQGSYDRNHAYSALLPYFFNRNNPQLQQSDQAGDTSLLNAEDYDSIRYFRPEDNDDTVHNQQSMDIDNVEQDRSDYEIDYNRIPQLNVWIPTTRNILVGERQYFQPFDSNNVQRSLQERIIRQRDEFIRYELNPINPTSLVVFKKTKINTKKIRRNIRFIHDDEDSSDDETSEDHDDDNDYHDDTTQAPTGTGII